METSGFKVASIDFETFYDSKSGYSLRDMTPYEYVMDKRFDAYLVAVAAPGGFEYVGHPADCPWELLTGATLLAHNAAFDGLVLKRIQELGIVPKFDFAMEDTADMAAYLLAPRNLGGAAKILLGKTVDKHVRSDMDGKTMADVRAEDAKLPSPGPGAVGPTEAALLKYGCDDAKVCLELWLRCSHRYPEDERAMSRMNREANWKGIRVDLGALDAGIEKLSAVVKESEAKMPWVANGKKAGSLAAFSRHAKEVGILDVPVSLNRQDPAVQAWVERNAVDHEFVKARFDHSGTVPHLARLNSLKRMLAGGDILRPSVKYFASHTGRFAADKESENLSKFNLLNMGARPVSGVDVRGMLIPRDGCVFLVFDYCQIEARIVQWLAGGEKMLGLIEKEGNLYQAYAKLVKWFPEDGKGLSTADPSLYKKSKIAVLSLGYGMGARKFFARCTMFKMGVDEQWCVDTVAAFRENNPEVVALWYYHDDALRSSIRDKDPTHDVCLPSGRTKTYYDICELPSDVLMPSGKPRMEKWAAMVAGTPKKRVWGGLLVENITQATARDVLRDGALECARVRPCAEYRMNAHDEVVFEVPESEAEECLPALQEALCVAKTTWAKGCPIEVEVVRHPVTKSPFHKRYLKG